MNSAFLTKDFLLDTEVARTLYNEFAADSPIIDFHNHLSAADIAEDRGYDTITPLWLESDHYKWRAMRANGVPEHVITGKSSDYDRFLRWAETVPYTFRNPLYHWTHLELRRAFGVWELLTPDSAPQIYDKTIDLLGTPEFTTRRLIERSGTVTLCTTDDPTDSLEHHRRLQADENYAVWVLPTFRPDKVLAIGDSPSFNAWIGALEDRSDKEIRTYDDLLDALQSRHDDFHETGCRLSDLGLETFPAGPFSDQAASEVFVDVRSGKAANAEEAEAYRSTTSYHLARMNQAKGWAQQFHVGPIRNVNSRLGRRSGADAGFDSIGDWPHARSMAVFLDRLDREGVLAKSILYNANPRDNAVFATMAGNFNDGSIPGKIQYGPPWWFLDQFDGIVEHLSTLSNFGLLAHFVGMVTDSRSLLSLYSRHEYFRRVLCRVIGRDVGEGILPDDVDWLGDIVRGICSENARAYFGFDDQPGARNSTKPPIER